MTAPALRLAATLSVAIAFAAIFAIIFTGPRDAAAGTWNGLAVAPEHRCSPYDRKDYPYPQSVELDLIATMGGRMQIPTALDRDSYDI